MEKKMIKVTNAQRAENDWRTYIFGQNEKGKYWEVRGYGETEAEAEAQAKERFNDDSKYWDCYGYEIPGVKDFE